ncbi:uncharacterized protein LOC113275144 isoform X1 [Papaver somniferum]|uniref:uncharacterized protein LOC113275144 isoform X1 n=1 Tax=Papaver somniferum TaxID=3469 RepID=UPI000E6FD6A5|nr:uncharacterized protein LOC113275144 isoform X1 [Papaver somniferum]
MPYPAQHLNSGCNQLLGMYDFDFSLCLIPRCICMWRRVYHTWKGYSWTKISIRKLGTQVVLIVNQQLVVVKLLVYLSWKYKLLNSENYESLAIREEEAQLHFDSVKFVLQSLSYTQHDSNSCVWMWILTSAVCFFNYLCYPYSVFDRGKRLANSDLRYDNGSLVSELDLRPGYSSEFQFRFLIVFLLVNYGGSGGGVRLFLEISYLYIGRASIFTSQWIEVMKFSKTFNFFGLVPVQEEAQIFSLHSGFLELKGVCMTLHNLSYLLIGVFNSAGYYVGIHGLSLMVSLTFFLRSFTLFEDYLWVTV